MNKKSKGDFYEDYASHYLKMNGVIIVERNYRCKIGEVDIIGIDGNCLVFFEVKYRKSDCFGNPLQAIDYKKQRKIINTAKYYLAYTEYDLCVRFDAIGICGNEIEWIQDAFCM